MEWWTEVQAGMIGGIVGGGVGGILYGAIGGGVCGPLAGKGLARRFVMGYITACAALGVVLLGIGLYALVIGQPFHVWFVPVQIGLLGSTLGIGGYFLFRRIYRQHEQRTLAAEEFRRA